MSDPSPPSPLFPPLQPTRSGMLAVDALHTIYWEECGNPDGIPVIFLHGGPGGGLSPKHRQFFDPKAYRIVLFDQRGAGQSTPLGETRNNTTQLLIDDIEAIRRMLGITQWLVFGGSWGATLALAYGQAHPQACLGFVLRGIFLCTQAEIDWFMYGIRNFSRKRMKNSSRRFRRKSAAICCRRMQSGCSATMQAFRFALRMYGVGMKAVAHSCGRNRRRSINSIAMRSR
jgi:proline iminopeptidase